MGIPQHGADDGWAAAPAGLLRWEAQGRTRGARQSVLRAAGACSAKELIHRIADDMPPRELEASHEAFRYLRECVHQYAAKLRFLGYSTRSAAGMVLAAVRESGPDSSPHPAILCAAEEWALEADHGAPDGG